MPWISLCLLLAVSSATAGFDETWFLLANEKYGANAFSRFTLGTRHFFWSALMGSGEAWLNQHVFRVEFDQLCALEG
jgi:hypothetical protein